ncbi:carbohydrate binding domain-containing protein [Bythopirellula goksoeyrii]|uniref:PEP-CTERM protein-sorting domain-containing protein n=1 Tax=Bythopirellula goksoeyrii TaxID=1400387 RepID=A0A5B9QHG8_9BACT|nr:hypothetical protein [Bythopirellula goksoeyrii]QEG36416.1 hypothetical protein Pr1d_37300 [Bythopirellula goksoeyrii]
MKLLRDFQVLSILAMMPVFVENASANILLNPGFEIGTGDDADDWLEVAGPSGSTTRSNAMPNSGSFSAYMMADHINNPAAPTPYAIEQIQPVGSIDNGLNYNLSFSAKVDSLNFDGFDMFYQILWLDQDVSDGGGVKGETLTQLIPAGINTSYQSFGLIDMDVPSGADSFLLRIQLSPGAVGGIANGLYVDDVNLSPVTSGGLLGDFDTDGDVDGADLLKWQRGETTPALNATDLANWQLNYDMQSPPIAANLAAIPEPSAFCLLSLGVYSLLCRNLNRASS